MGVLKAKVSGSWVNLTVGGASPYPGGQVGEVLVKQSSSLNDALWTTQVPKLHITSTTNPGLATTNLSLSVGDLNSYNTVLYQTGVQTRLNGAAAGLNLNPYGGTVGINVLETANNPIGLQIPATGHATSKRAAVYVGSWLIGQDIALTGSLDFFIWKSSVGLGINAGNTIVSFVGDRWSIGLHPTHASNGIWLGGASPGNEYTILKYGTQTLINNYGGSMEFRIDNVNKLRLDSSAWAYFPGGGVHFPASVTFRASSYYFNSADNGSNFFSIADSTCKSYLSLGFTTAGWFRAEGNSGLFFPTHNTGVYATQASWVDTYNGAWFLSGGGMAVTIGYPYRIAGRNDTNHELKYESNTPTGSGEASNGPRLSGYSSVWLYNMFNKSFFLASSGNVFISAGQTYNAFSSREHKENIVPLDPEESLDMVRRWQPVEYDLIEDGKHKEGFISEDHALVTPDMCNIEGEDSERPGWANAVAYGHGTVRLTGAVQALLKRIEELEKKVA